jgi:hypothetical protein
METHAKEMIRVAICSTVVLSLLLFSISCGKNQPKGGRMPGSAEQVWSTMVSSAVLSTESIESCHKESNCVEAIISIWRNAGLAEKIQAMPKFVRLGGQRLGPDGDVPARIGPYLVDARISAMMVEALGHEDSDLRDEAGKILANQTPDSLVRNHWVSIEKVLTRFPVITDATLLIGKMGSQSALAFLRRSKELQNADTLDVQAAFGKLGVQTSEIALVSAYNQEKDPREKRQLAWYLGYMAKPGCVNALAQDLRSPLAYEWNQKAKRSFRIHVISALSLSYPEEPLLWKPFYGASGDEYYSAIEQWAVNVLGTEWTKPRPPFLYEEEVPMRKPAPPLKK